MTDVNQRRGRRPGSTLQIMEGMGLRLGVILLIGLCLSACKSGLDDKPKVYCSVAAPALLVNGVAVTGNTLTVGTPVRLSFGTDTCAPTDEETFWQSPDGSVVHNTCLDFTPAQAGPVHLVFHEYIASCEEVFRFPADFVVR